MKNQDINPFKTDKTAANGNLRLRKFGLCLKWKPQVKCRQNVTPE